MVESSEKFSSVDDNPETGSYESEPSDKHQVYIEQDETQLMAERRDYLADAIGDNARGRTTKNAEYYKMLDNWKDRLPEHTGTIQELEKKGGLAAVAAEAWNSRDRNKINSVQALLKDALISYGNDWDKLSEQDKRAVRVAEMTVFITDTIKMGMDLENGRVNREAANNLIDKMGSYCSSVDIPPSFRDSFLKTAVERLKDDLSRAGSSPRGARYKGRYNSVKPEGKSNTPRSQVVQEEYDKLTGSGNSKDTDPNKDVVDMEYDPDSGSFMPSEEIGKTKQPKEGENDIRRLGYAPNSNRSPQVATPPAPQPYTPDTKPSAPTQMPTLDGASSAATGGALGGGGEAATGGGGLAGGGVPGG